MSGYSNLFEISQCDFVKWKEADWKSLLGFLQSGWLYSLLWVYCKYWEMFEIGDL